MYSSFRLRYIKKEFIIAFILLFNTFSWYYSMQIMINKMGYSFGENLQSNLIWISYLFSIIVSIVFGSILSTKLRRVFFLRMWVLMGVLASVVLAILTNSSFLVSLFIVCLLGTSLGVGIPLCFSYFTEFVPIEHRGKIGGAIFFMTFLIAPFLSISMSVLNTVSGSIFTALWRIWCLPGLFMISEKKETELITSKKTVPFPLILHNKSFYLYFISWLIFAFMTSFEDIVIKNAIGALRLYMNIIEPVAAAISAIVVGVFSDRIGRKRIIIVGFVLLGIAFAALGLMPYTYGSWIFHFIASGIALGSLWTLFVVVIWGDIAFVSSERFYALGEIPFFLSGIFSLIFTPYLALIPQSNAFSLAAFFLFVAVIPLLYAPETLPEKKIREIELRLYVEKAKKIKQRYTK